VHGSVGRPLAGIELRVVGPDGQDLTAPAAPDEAPAADEPGRDPLDTVADAPDAGEVGRIVIRGATLFSGYWPNGGGGPDADGWFVTGDIGFLDDAGELHLVDRAAEVITVSGFTVYPREIEDVLTGHPAVVDVAVIGVPAAEGHEELAAVLVADADRAVGEEELREFAGARLPAFKQPAVYRVVPALPKTEVGRVDRDRVRGLFGPGVQQALPTLVAVPDAEHADATEPAADVTPEPAGDLAQLGTRLPATGDRAERARDDTDEDLF
jgi:long-chain acyl-CoA synthetase